MQNAGLVRLALAVTLPVAMANPAGAQRSTSPQASWAGWARCQLDVTGSGYSDSQTQTWTISGGAPTVKGAFRIYPGTWSVVGGGKLEKTEGKQTLKAEWATNTPDKSGPIAVFVRASDRKMFIQARHSQLRGTSGIQGYQQLTIDGKAQKPANIDAETFEWQFPEVAVYRPNPTAPLMASGSSNPVAKGSIGFMQPGGSQAKVSCTWSFSGGAAPEAPPPVIVPSVPKPPPASLQ